VRVLTHRPPNPRTQDLLAARRATDMTTSTVRMPFGKFVGVALTELPDQYIAWLLNLGKDLREPLRQFVIDENIRRERVRHAERAAALVTADVVDAAHEIIKQGVRALMRRHHPDAGGSVEAMASVNNAAEVLRTAIDELAARHL
jgi:DNA replication initiation complex subunit (GINS family)